MPRQIKFRGRRVDNGEWVTGYYYESTFGSRYVIKANEGEYDVDPATLGQSTGRKDSEGNDIYSGDKVQFVYWWFDGRENDTILEGEIVYMPELMSFGLKGVKNADWIRHIGGDQGSEDTVPFATLTFSEEDFTVIGNVHDTLITE